MKEQLFNFKKLNIVMPVAILLLLTLAFSGCTKKEVDEPEFYQIQSTVSNWIKQKSDHILDPQIRNFVDSISAGIDWKNLAIASTDFQSKKVLIPVKYESKELGLLVEITKKTNQIKSAIIVQSKNNESTPHSQLEIIQSLYFNNGKNVRSSLAAFTLENKFLTEIGITRDNRGYKKNIRKNNDAAIKSHNDAVRQTGQIVKLNGCTAYYLVTYWDDGSIDRQYIGTICDDTGAGNGSGCEQTYKIGSNPELQISTNCTGQGGGGSSGSNGNSTVNTVNGPKICWKSIVLSPQGVGSDVNQAKIWGIPAIYQTPNGTVFSLVFGMSITAPTNILSMGGWNYVASNLQYYSLWNNGDITQNANGTYTYSKYAQRQILADATDYASYKASAGVKSGETVSAPGYKAEFQSFFNEWINQYFPGATMSILHGDVTGSTYVKLTDGDPSTCQ